MQTQPCKPNHESRSFSEHVSPFAFHIVFYVYARVMERSVPFAFHYHCFFTHLDVGWCWYSRSITMGKTIMNHPGMVYIHAYTTYFYLYTAYFYLWYLWWIGGWFMIVLPTWIPTGWWYTYPSEKYESQLGWWHSIYEIKIWKSVGMMTFHIWNGKS
jgi:hypothetical protein